MSKIFKVNKIAQACRVSVIYSLEKIRSAYSHQIALHFMS